MEIPTFSETKNIIILGLLDFVPEVRVNRNQISSEFLFLNVNKEGRDKLNPPHRVKEQKKNINCTMIETKILYEFDLNDDKEEDHVSFSN